MLKLLLLFIPLLMAMSSPHKYCVEWKPPTTRTNGTLLKPSEISHYRMKVNGKDYHKLIPGSASRTCFWFDTNDPVCPELMTVDTGNRPSPNWYKAKCQ